jgi:hypothetical protein
MPMPHTLWSCQHFDGAHGWHAHDDDSATRTLLGPPIAAPADCAEIVPSWAATTSDGSWIEIDLRVRQDGRWSPFYRMALWDAAEEHSRRQSFDAQPDEMGHVATDTLVIHAAVDAVQPRVLLHGTPSMRALRLCMSAPPDPAPFVMPHACREIHVPPRSQMIYPNGGEVWCSPTSVAMLLAYWYERTGAPQLAPFAALGAIPAIAVPGMYDPIYEGHGNWSFNVAFAARYGMEAYVTRFERLRDLEPWLQAGVPAAISISWQPGTLQNACIPSSNGHLLVVAGFDDDGNVIVADPAARDAAGVRRLYRADELERAWQHTSHGTTYMIHPVGFPVPHTA